MYIPFPLSRAPTKQILTFFENFLVFFILFASNNSCSEKHGFSKDRICDFCFNHFPFIVTMVFPSTLLSQNLCKKYETGGSI